MKRHIISFGWPAVALVLFWSLLIVQVQNHWGSESYYNFGWFVPPLAIWLFLKNLQGLQERPFAPTKYLLACCIAGLVLIPLQALVQVSPYWRIPLWLQASVLSGVTLALLHMVYGRKGVLAGAFPLFFLLTMIPWPYRIEVIIIQSMTKVVVQIAMSWLHLLGYDVTLAGSSFLWQDLQIGVNEACSGIRSLQALFMVSLFLGSIFGQGVMRRLLVIAILPFIVILVNSARATFLTTQVILNGHEAYQKWHDPAGYIAFAVSMALIYLCIELLNIGAKNKAEESLSMSWLQVPLKWSWRPLPTAAAALLSMPLIIIGTVEGWFLYSESKSPPRNHWRFEMVPESVTEHREVAIHEDITSTLNYSYAQRILFHFRDEIGGEIYYYGYDNENKIASVSSYAHSPTICMETIGAQLKEKYSALVVPAGSFQIPFEHYLFIWPQDQRELHVFWVLWENRDMNIEPQKLYSLDYHTQFVQLLRGRRDFSRQALLMSISGTSDAAEARSMAETLLKDWIQTD